MLRKKLVIVIGFLVLLAAACSNSERLNESSENPKKDQAKIDLAIAPGLRWSDCWYVDGQDRLRELDPMTGNWLIRETNIKGVTGSYYINGVFEATFLINMTGEIFQNTGGWTRRYGCYNAADIASYDINSTYAINANGQVYKYSPSWKGFDWHSMIPNESAKRISVDEKGIPWVVTTSGKIFKYVDNAWIIVPFTPSADDIGCNAGLVYAVGYNRMGHSSLYKLNGSSWEYVSSEPPIRVDVNRDGDVYIIGTELFILSVKMNFTNEFVRIMSTWGDTKEIGM